MPSPRCTHCDHDLTAPFSILYHVPAQQMAHLESGKGVVYDDDGMAFPSSRHQPVCIKCGWDVVPVIAAVNTVLKGLVRPSQGCPSCQERDPDKLALGEGEFEDYVKCRTCGCLYDVMVVLAR